MLSAGDLCVRLIDFLGGDQGGGRNLALVRRAVQDAVRDFPTLHQWNWYKGLGRVNLHASYAIGTVAVNSSARIVTLTGGTFPTWAGRAQVRVGSVVGRVASRDSGTQLTLDPVLTFPADIPSGTAYRLFLDSYLLPADFSAGGTPMKEDWWGGLRYTPPGGYLWNVRGEDITGTPIRFTIMPDPYSAGRMALLVSPYPDEDRTLDFVYLRTMRRVKYDLGNTAGTVAVTGAAVVGTGTAFRSDYVGAIFRASADATSPEAAPQSAVEHESIITAVADGTHLTLADSAPSALSGVGYAVSDPLDLEPAAMATAFQWLAARTCAAESGHKGFTAADKLYNEWIQKARAADSRYVGPDQAGPVAFGRPYRFRGPVITEG